MNKSILLNGVDFGVEVEGTKTASGTKIPNRFAIVRTDTGEPISVVGSEYKVQDHKKGILLMARVLDKVSGDYSVKHVVNGARIYSHFMLKSHAIMDKYKDERAYLRVKLVNSYDGSNAWKYVIDIFRQICGNGMGESLADIDSARRIHSKHLNIEQVVMDELPAHLEAYRQEYEVLYNGLKEIPAISEKKLIKSLPIKLVGTVADETKKEKKAGKENAWEQYNRFTHIISHNKDIQEVRRQAISALVTSFYHNLVTKA